MELSSSDWDLFVDGSFHDNIILAENSNVLGEPIHAQLGMQMEMEMVEIGHLDSIQDLAPLPHGEQEGPYPQMMPLLPPPPPPPVPLPDTQNLELLNQNYFLDEEKSLSPPSTSSCGLQGRLEIQLCFAGPPLSPPQLTRVLAAKPPPPPPRHRPFSFPRIFMAFFVLCGVDVYR